MMLILTDVKNSCFGGSRPWHLYERLAPLSYARRDGARPDETVLLMLFWLVPVICGKNAENGWFKENIHKSLWFERC
jgi:hypothetical protein